MEKLLFVDATVRPRGLSRTAALADRFLNAYRAAHQGNTVVERKLVDLPLSPHTAQGLVERDRLLAAGATDDCRFELAREFASADRLVIAAPFWDLSFPAILKIYIENISVCGLTFGFDGNRMFGLCRSKRLLYITTRGGDFSGADRDMEMALPQLNAYSKMFGLGPVSCISADGIDIFGADSAAILEKAALEAERLAADF